MTVPTHRSRQKGFTLIEILIVVAIIGILASIAVPMFLDYRYRAYNTMALTDLKNFQTGMEAYFADNKEYPAL
jgi:prepilin-type N-terminal cleavage/methylation domain-containing protein